MEKVILDIKGMSCGHCKSSVERILKETKGVKDALVNLNAATAEVIFDEKTVTKEKLIVVINESGMFTAA